MTAERPSAPAPSAFRRYWTRLVKILFGVWAILFLIVLTHVDFTLLHLFRPTELFYVRKALVYMLPIFVVNLVLRYRWSGLTPVQFARRNWLDVLMILPVLRVLQFVRFFRVGRAALVIRHVGKWRKVFNFSRKMRRQLAKVLRARAGASPAAALAPGAGAVTGSVAGVAAATSLPEESRP